MISLNVKALLAAASICMLLTAPVFAAEPAPIWTGIYAGGHLGGAFGTDDYSASQGPRVSFNGLTGGVHAGYNFPKFSSVILGVEGDFSWSQAKGTSTIVSPPDTVSITSSVNYLASVRGRVGLPVDDFLIYATAGVAWTETKLTANIDQGAFTSQGSTTSVGYVVGGGIETMLPHHLTGRIEGLYYGFGDSNLPVRDSTGISGSTKISRDAAEVRAGLSYHFN